MNRTIEADKLDKEWRKEDEDVIKDTSNYFHTSGTDRRASAEQFVGSYNLVGFI